MEFGNSCNIFLFKWRQLTVHMWKSMSATLICLQPQLISTIAFSRLLLFVLHFKAFAGLWQNKFRFVMIRRFFFALTDVLFTFLQAFFSDQPAFSKSGFCNLLRFSKIFFLHYYNLRIFFFAVCYDFGGSRRWRLTVCQKWCTVHTGAQNTEQI